MNIKLILKHFMIFRNINPLNYLELFTKAENTKTENGITEDSLEKGIFGDLRYFNLLKTYNGVRQFQVAEVFFFKVLSP